jgi:acyl-coenzyme A thioesterase PaaI-like protein
MDIERDNFCFCCGADNENSLHLVITYPEPGCAETTLVGPDWFSGWRGVTNEGFLSTVLDEIMAHACISIGGPTEAAVTAEMMLRFLRPVQTGSRIRAAGRVTEVKGRIIRTEGRLLAASGGTAAESSARFVIAKKDPPA